MRRWNGLGRSLLFGALAAAAYIPFAIVATPLFGWSGAVAAYAVVSAAVYLGGLGPTLRQGLAASLLLGLGVGAIAVVAPSDRDVVLAAALALGVLRSGLLYRSRFARALAIESALACGALLVAGADLRRQRCLDRARGLGFLSGRERVLRSRRNHRPARLSGRRGPIRGRTRTGTGGARRRGGGRFGLRVAPGRGVAAACGPASPPSVSRPRRSACPRRRDGTRRSSRAANVRDARRSHSPPWRPSCAA